MTAMDRQTGKAILGRDEIEQSIDEILSTNRGDRVMRADYGSDLLDLVDVGMNASGKAKLSQATADAIARHEPRVRITRVIARAQAGELHYEVHGEVNATAAQIRVQR
jgi:phage baseplate assembly protein W